MMTGWGFNMNGGDLYDDSSRFYYEKSKLSWWQVDILVIKGEDFCNDRLRFS